MTRCDIRGCGSVAVWWVHKPGFGIRYVCQKCMEEMLATMGWALGGRA